jgi:hypothetical protein
VNTGRRATKAHTLVATLPCLEVLIAIAEGTKARSVLDIWGTMVASIDGRLRAGYDNVRWRGPLTNSASGDRSINAAILAAAGGSLPDRGSTDFPDWASLSFVDVLDVDALPGTSAHCSLGWSRGRADPRGVSLRITVPNENTSWTTLLEMARDMAIGADPVWRWMTVGYRFVPPSFQSASLAESLRAIFQLSKRFRAVDVGDPLAIHTTDWISGIRSVGFLTALAPSMLIEHGTPASDGLRAARFERVHGALFVYAGADPSCVDVNRGDSPDGYREADQICRQLRREIPLNFLAPWDQQSSAEWLNRWAFP